MNVGCILLVVVVHIFSLWILKRSQNNDHLSSNTQPWCPVVVLKYHFPLKGSGFLLGKIATTRNGTEIVQDKPRMSGILGIKEAFKDY